MSGLTDIRVPSESFEGTRAQLLRWLKPLGAAVVEGEPLLEAETDKVTVEIAAPASGTLTETCKQASEEITVGDLLGRIATDGSSVAASARTASAPSAPRAVPRPTVVPGASGAATALSPAVRRLLAQHGLDPALIRSAGGARITVDDVLAHVAGQTRAAAGSEAAVRRELHSATRRTIAARMVESLLHTAPHVTTVFEVDLSRVLAHRQRQRASSGSTAAAPTLTAYFVAACVPAIGAVPEVNARWTEDALEIFERIDIGIATAVEGKGLVVPVLRNVAALDLSGIATELGRLTARARSDSLTPADVRGGTFTISNHGVSGSLIAAPVIINQPQSAILGVGKVERRAVVIEDGGRETLGVRPRCYVSLTIDHRVMDGHRANRFLATWAAAIEQWPD